MKRIISLCLALCLLMALIPAAAAADATYTDVPKDSWATAYIEAARVQNLMQGKGSGVFGYGQTVTNAEFATMLCNIMGWELINPEQPTYADVEPGSWYYQTIETATANGAYYQTNVFNPMSAITRVEMAMAFVCALGLDAAATLEENQPSAFADVTVRKGYVNVANNIGLMQGKSDDHFDPNATAKREEAATLLVRFYEKYNAKTDFLHGFYAISAYSQRDLAATMDAVTYQWSTLMADGALNTTTGDSRIPDGYDSITELLNGKTKQHLGVYMDEAGGVQTLLLDAQKRAAAVEAIVAELDKPYALIGRNPYSGVTIDLEGLRGDAVKQGLNSFLTALSEKLKPSGRTLYVAVQPALPDGVYYDGFDYKTIGELADKVILMAHDYNPTTLKGYEGTTWHQNAALTPISQIYYALKAVTDPQTGVADKSKLTLAISFASLGWYITDDGKLASPTPVHVSPARVAEVLSLPTTETGFSTTYRNPYAIYQTDEGEKIFLWHENAQSVSEKLSLAQCFGITGVSLWRLGTIPNTPGYDVTGCW